MKFIKNNILIFIAFLLISNLFSGIIITEIMPLSTNDSYNEFIEIYNNSEQSIDVSGWSFSDGDALDNIVAWNTASLTNFNSNLTFNTTIIPAQKYAIILDKDYLTGARPYSIPDETIILTIENTVLGGSGIANNDPITIYDASGSSVTTYGTPILTNKTNNLSADDDGLDAIPITSLTAGKSVERKDYSVGDIATNWGLSVSASSNTIGEISSLVGGTNNGAPTESNLKILINEVMPDNGDDDWIEFFVTEGSGTIKDFKLYQGNTLVKTFSDISVNTSDYFVLNFGKTDLTEDTTKGEKGYFIANLS